MGETILDLMDYATLGGALAPTLIDLTAIARQVLEDLGQLLGEARVDLAELGSAYASPSPLRAVFSNLVSNAVKFSAPLGVPRIVIRAEDVVGRVRVTVTDNGPGVRADEREKIFGLLSRGTTQVSGHGIGLATAAAILASHGGAIGVDDAPDGGACFWFELPNESEAESA
jgi:signal transduction histidine kinase